MCIYGIPLVVFVILFSAYFTGPCKFPQPKLCFAPVTYYDMTALLHVLSTLESVNGEKLDLLLCSPPETHPHFPVQAAASHEYRSSKVQAV